ncbi:MAG: SDR family NAD(P)-dependent oxidoreductase [Clostridiales bacterium]|nr:SDR family NAD(P)-dependent oxidoreductase [Clostridiales bacterium]
MESSLKKIAIITGASSGLGREFVKIIHKKEAIQEIWAIARHQEQLEKLRAQIGNKVIPVPMDLSDFSQIEALGKRLSDSEVTICYLINNAGYGKFASYDDLGVEESINMLNLNINAVVAVSLTCIPYMCRGAHIINTASQAAFQPLPYLNLYSASKAFVRNYTRSLHIELKDRGITATAVCPGWMKTNFFQRADIGAAKSISSFFGISSAAKVARKAIADADRGRDLSIYSLYVNICHIFSKLVPQKWMMYFWLRQQHINPYSRPSQQ